MLKSQTLRILLVGLIVVVAASLLPLGVSGYVLGLLTVAYYFGVFSMAWDLLFGFAGEVNFGPTFLIGTGAYTAGILDNLYGLPIRKVGPKLTSPAKPNRRSQAIENTPK